MIEQAKDLSQLTTFHIPAKARYFARYNSVEALKKLMRTEAFRDNEWLHIGAGSNLLFTGDYNGLILKSDILGRTAYRKDADTVLPLPAPERTGAISLTGRWKRDSPDSKTSSTFPAR